MSSVSALKTISILFLAFALIGCGGKEEKLVGGTEDRSTANDRGNDRTELNSVSDSTPDTTERELTTDDAPGIPAVGAATITDVVLITGQSNALGSETTFDPVLDQPVDRVFAYTDNGWQPASLRQVWDLGWHPARGLDGDPHNNFGFHFGKSVVSQRSDRVIGLILVTAPGEGISHWDIDGFFFNKIRNKALLALNALPHKSGVDGILWHQGETDWGKSGTSDPDFEEFQPDDFYSDRLWRLINNFRTETWFESDRPFICGETARSPINNRLNALNRDRDNWTACVPGEGLPTYDVEAVHFSAAGLRQLGANYADVYLQMTN